MYNTIRIKKSAETLAIAIVDNALINDDRLSLEAKGLATYLQVNQGQGVEQIVDTCSNSYGSIESAIRELEHYGYATPNPTPVPEAQS